MVSKCDGVLNLFSSLSSVKVARLESLETRGMDTPVESLTCELDNTNTSVNYMMNGGNENNTIVKYH